MLGELLPRIFERDIADYDDLYIRGTSTQQNSNIHLYRFKYILYTFIWISLFYKYFIIIVIRLSTVGTSLLRSLR